MEKFNFENLEVYKQAILFADMIYSSTRSWPKDEIFGLTNQLRRASVSIALNIAEGSSRTKKDFRHFLDLSRGSCFECVAILTIAQTQKYITLDEYSEFYAFCNQLSRMISGLRKSLILRTQNP